MTTQSSLQYSFTFTHSDTHSYSASISSTLLFYEGQFRVQHLVQGHFGMQMGKTGDRTADLQVAGQPLFPSATAAPMCESSSTDANHLGPSRASAYVESSVWDVSISKNSNLRWAAPCHQRQRLCGNLEKLHSSSNLNPKPIHRLSI